MYWLPPSRVKQSGKATTTGGMRCSPISRSSRSGRFSRKPAQFVWDRPLPVKPTRSTSRGNPCPSCPAGTYTSTTRTDGSPSILLFRAELSMATRLTKPIGPKNLRMNHLWHPPKLTPPSLPPLQIRVRLTPSIPVHSGRGFTLPVTRGDHLVPGAFVIRPDSLFDRCVPNNEKPPPLHIAAARSANAGLQDLPDQRFRHRVLLQPPHRAVRP